MQIRLTNLFSLVAISLTILMPMSTEAADNAKHEFYEIRQYTILDEAGESAIDDYLGNALLPALERQGIGPIGVLVSAPQDENEQRRIVMITPLAQPGKVNAIRRKLAEDTVYQAAAADFMSRGNKDPAYGRVVTELSVSMDCMMQHNVPKGTLENSDRVYELRTYESVNERVGDLKVEMFNSGEVPIFHAVGITPVFISQTVVGPQMPSLTYLSLFPSEEARLKAWNDFRVNPEWKVLSKDPKYLGTVSRIDKYVLVAKPYSQM